MMRLTVLVFCVLAVCFVTCQATNERNQYVTDRDGDAGYDDNDRTRSGRSAYWNPRAPGRRYGGRKPKMPNTHIKMPSGRSYDINDAAYLKNECGTRPKLVYLSPHGKMGKKEYDIVSNEVWNTRKDIGEASRELEIVKIEKVLNNCLWRKYKSYQDEIKREFGHIEERMLFNEGSDFENIIHTGFKEKHTVDDIFGRALYFAKDSSTAHWHGIPNYSRCADCKRVMLLCRVTLGNVLNQSSDKFLPGPPKEYHSVRGLPAEGGLSYEEYAVYNPAQVYPEYVITYKAMPLRGRSSGGGGCFASDRRDSKSTR